MGEPTEEISPFDVGHAVGLLLATDEHRTSTLLVRGGTVAVKASGGVGLGGMRERADFVGGRLVVESAKNVGTVVRLEVPIP